MRQRAGSAAPAVAAAALRSALLCLVQLLTLFFTHCLAPQPAPLVSGSRAPVRRRHQHWRQQRRPAPLTRAPGAAAGEAAPPGGSAGSSGSDPVIDATVDRPPVGLPSEGMDPKVSEALLKVQQALADAEKSMQVGAAAGSASRRSYAPAAACAVDTWRSGGCKTQRCRPGAISQLCMSSCVHVPQLALLQHKTPSFPPSLPPRRCPQTVDKLPSARVPTAWDPLLAALRPLGQFAALCAVCTAVHAFGSLARVLGSLAVGVAAAGWGWRRNSLDVSGAVAVSRGD